MLLALSLVAGLLALFALYIAVIILVRRSGTRNSNPAPLLGVVLPKEDKSDDS